MPTVGLVIQVPKLTEQYRDNVFLQMRALLDLCEDGLKLLEEEARQAEARRREIYKDT